MKHIKAPINLDRCLIAVPKLEVPKAKIISIPISKRNKYLV
jgi:hypothetical protein